MGDPKNRAQLSHEAACLLNLTGEETDIAITIFFEDREPTAPYRLRRKSRRTLHPRFR